MITLNEALGDAQRKRIAIGHFNVSDLVALKAVTGAARALKVPVLNLLQQKGAARNKKGPPVPDVVRAAPVSRQRLGFDENARER